jgi:hypothetical protein
MQHLDLLQRCISGVIPLGSGCYQIVNKKKEKQWNCFRIAVIEINPLKNIKNLKT